MKGIRVLALIALGFLSVTSMMGGIPLILDPSGGLLHMPLSLLEHSPFHNFLIPGIILLVANGLLSVVAFVATIRRGRGFGILVAFQGCVIVGWITVEVIVLRSVAWPHYLYRAMGLILIGSGIMLRRDGQAASPNTIARVSTRSFAAR
jgi:hypothetical protein